MNNTHLYGFRWSFAANGYAPPPIFETSIATAQDDQDDTNASVNINVGDPLKLVNTGGMIVCKTTLITHSICMGVKEYWDGTKMVIGNKLPNATAWGTIEARRSIILTTPATAGVWEIDIDGAAGAGATTYAGFRAMVGENIEHAVPGANTALTADPKLIIAGHAATATLGWRIVGVSPNAANRDFSGTNVKLLVRINESQEAGMPVEASIVIGV